MAGLFADYFLLFLLAAAAGGYFVYRVYVPREEAPAPEGAASFDYRDPYLIAALRGGPAAVIELAVVALLDRGLLQSDDVTFDENARVRVSRPDAAEFAGSTVERALLGAAASSIGVRDVVAKAAVIAAADAYADRISRLGLTTDRETRVQRRAVRVLCFVPALIMVLVRIKMTPAHAITFLFLGAIVIGPAFYFALQKGAARGEAMLAELAVLFAGLAERADDLRRGRMVSDAMFCAATFGLWRLPAAEFPAAVFYSAEERRRRSKDDGGSSCGSGSCGGSGCGSDSGGDGGGGCGGGCGGG